MKSHVSACRSVHHSPQLDCSDGLGYELSSDECWQHSVCWSLATVQHCCYGQAAQLMSLRAMRYAFAAAYTALASLGMVTVQSSTLLNEEVCG